MLFMTQCHQSSCCEDRLYLLQTSDAKNALNLLRSRHSNVIVITESFYAKINGNSEEERINNLQVFFESIRYHSCSCVVIGTISAATDIKTANKVSKVFSTVGADMVWNLANKEPEKAWSELTHFLPLEF